ncbi:10219_t:CDS:2, partial [Dentiscutata heterogama]
DNFDKWARRKEYRGYIHIPSFNVKCDTKGYLVTANPRDSDYRNKKNLTKNPEQYDDAKCNPYGVYMTVCCNHQVSVTVHRTIFPQTSLYINSKRVSKQAQTELGKFIFSRGKSTKKLKIPNRNLTIANIITFLKKNKKDLVKLLLANEHGNLALYGQDLTWNGKV